MRRRPSVITATSPSQPTITRPTTSISGCSSPYVTVFGGFGAIHWVDQLTLANPFAGKAERSMIEHMNSDHTKAIAHYVDLVGLPTSEPAQLAGIDSEGMHLRIGQSLYWLPFAESCNTPTQVREALVSLAHAEVWPKKATADA